MNTLDYSINRINSLLEKIEKLKQLEFPYKSSKTALEILEERFEDHLNTLISLSGLSPSPTPSVVNNHCKITLNEINLYLPILGFILNSTSVDNAFETYGPLLRLSQNIIDSNTKLILSSEWENSPFVYPKISVLPNFILIGLPAQESENPLLLPLAGHELGHSIWKFGNFDIKYLNKIEERIVEEITTTFWDKYKEIYPTHEVDKIKNGLFERSTWMPAYEYTKRQIEEIFCDFVGLKIFAESYLYAFCYILSPGFPGQRLLYYPNLKQRIRNILYAAKRYDVDIPENYEENFEDFDEPSVPPIDLLIKIADKVSTQFIDDLANDVNEYIAQKEIILRNKSEVTKLKTSINDIVPMSQAKSLADILNAGWIYYLEDNLWEKILSIEKYQKIKILKEIILKSIEVFEIEERLK